MLCAGFHLHINQARAQAKATVRCTVFVFCVFDGIRFLTAPSRICLWRLLRVFPLLAYGQVKTSLGEQSLNSPGVANVC